MRIQNELFKSRNDSEGQRANHVTTTTKNAVPVPRDNITREGKKDTGGQDLSAWLDKG